MHRSDWAQHENRQRTGNEAELVRQRAEISSQKYRKEVKK